MQELRTACETVAAKARHVHIDHDAIAPYAWSLRRVASDDPDPEAHLLTGTREDLAAFWLTLDAINFGSGWFPTLRKQPGHSGYFTIATGMRRRFATHGPWSATELTEIAPQELAATLDQDLGHPLMALFAASLRDLGRHIDQLGGRFTTMIEQAEPHATVLVTTLGGWRCFEDVSTYQGIRLPFLKRAQIAAADLARVGAATFTDLDRLTMFADNLVPHVLRLDGVLHLAPDLVATIEQEELIAHGSPEEVEIRAAAVHAVELIVAELPDSSAIEIDQLLWNRGRGPRYKASPRHRSRTTAY